MPSNMAQTHHAAVPRPASTTGTPTPEPTSTTIEQDSPSPSLTHLAEYKKIHAPSGLRLDQDEKSKWKTFVALAFPENVVLCQCLSFYDSYDDMMAKTSIQSIARIAGTVPIPQGPTEYRVGAVGEESPRWWDFINASAGANKAWRTYLCGFSSYHEMTEHLAPARLSRLAHQVLGHAPETLQIIVEGSTEGTCAPPARAFTSIATKPVVTVSAGQTFRERWDPVRHLRDDDSEQVKTQFFIERTKAMDQQIAGLFFNSNPDKHHADWEEGWRKLARFLHIDESGLCSISKLKTSISKVLVSVMDLIDSAETGAPLKLWKPTEWDAFLGYSHRPEIVADWLTAATHCNKIIGRFVHNPSQLTPSGRVLKTTKDGDNALGRVKKGKKTKVAKQESIRRGKQVGDPTKQRSATVMEGTKIGGSAKELGPSNKGHALLLKMGWTSGTALGSANNKGPLQPAEYVVKMSRAGLGESGCT